jgi:hypothetical protein
MAATKKRSSARATGVDTKPYGDPIRDAIASGSLARMKRLETSTRKWIDQTAAELADVKKALAQMTRAMKKASG